CPTRNIRPLVQPHRAYPENGGSERSPTGIPCVETHCQRSQQASLILRATTLSGSLYSSNSKGKHGWTGTFVGRGSHHLERSQACTCDKSRNARGNGVVDGGVKRIISINIGSSSYSY